MCGIMKQRKGTAEGNATATSSRNSTGFQAGRRPQRGAENMPDPLISSANALLRQCEDVKRDAQHAMQLSGVTAEEAAERKAAEVAAAAAERTPPDDLGDNVWVVL